MLGVWCDEYAVGLVMLGLVVLDVSLLASLAWNRGRRG
jgi:hypothetical protein